MQPAVSGKLKEEGDSRDDQTVLGVEENIEERLGRPREEHNEHPPRLNRSCRNGR